MSGVTSLNGRDGGPSRLSSIGRVPGGDSVVEIDNATVVYRGGQFSSRQTVAVSGASLRIHARETLGLVGESGSGKTTIGRLILGLLRPTEGTVTFRGEDLRKARRRRRGRIQVVLQHPEWALNPALRLSTSISEPLVLRGGMARGERLQRVGDMLERVGLDRSFANRYPHELSGGQRQRASIARALITEPDLIVFDEAISALDVSAQAQVLNLIRDTQEQFGYAALFISHDLQAVRYVSHRVAVMYSGKVVAAAPSASFYGIPLHPYAQTLLGVAGERDPDAGGLRSRLEGVGCVYAHRCLHATELCWSDSPPVREIRNESLACHHAERIRDEILSSIGGATLPDAR